MATSDEKAVAILERAVQKKLAAVEALQLQLKEEKEELEGMELALEQKRRRLGKRPMGGGEQSTPEGRRSQGKVASPEHEERGTGDAPAHQHRTPNPALRKESFLSSAREVSPSTDRKPPTSPATKLPLPNTTDVATPGHHHPIPSSKRPRVEGEFERTPCKDQGLGQRDTPRAAPYSTEGAPKASCLPHSPQLPSSSAGELTPRRVSAGNAPEPVSKTVNSPVPARHSNSALKQAPLRTPSPQLRRCQPVDLVARVKSGSRSSPIQPRFQQPVYVQSQQKRRLRSLIFNPANPLECCVSSLDGSVSFWLLQRTGRGLTPISSVDALMSRRWPEDIAWSPDGRQVIAVYEADAKSTQLASISKGRPCRGVDARLHQKGVVHCINFMPWCTPQGGSVFATGGSDHAVVLWSEEPSAPADFAWKPKALHRSQHSAGVYGVAGMWGPQVVLSAGADKKCLGVDVTTQKLVLCHWHDAKCTGVFPNPKDPNLILTQTGSQGEQLSLIDFRASKQALHRFGWKQSSTDQQSALISACWSPNGLFISSGTQDPAIQLFDIRQVDRKAFRTISCHEKRVFVGRWHSELPVILSISSDLNIGVHPFTT